MSKNDLYEIHLATHRDFVLIVIANGSNTIINVRKESETPPNDVRSLAGHNGDIIGPVPQLLEINDEIMIISKEFTGFGKVTKINPISEKDIIALTVQPK